jgi:hypothetical protein
MNVISVIQERCDLILRKIHDIPQVSDVKQETDAKMAIPNRLRDFWINDPVTVLAISLLDDVFNHEKRYWDDFFLISHPYILQFFELPTAVRALLEFKNDSCVCPIRAFA